MEPKGRLERPPTRMKNFVFSKCQLNLLEMCGISCAGMHMNMTEEHRFFSDLEHHQLLFGSVGHSWKRYNRAPEAATEHWTRCSYRAHRSQWCCYRAHQRQCAVCSLVSLVGGASAPSLRWMQCSLRITSWAFTRYTRQLAASLPSICLLRSLF